MRRRRRRNRQGEPDVPAFGTVLRAELAVALHIEVSLHVADRKQESELRTDAEHARLEVAERARSAVAGELLIRIADQADMDLLGDKLRKAPVDMGIDAVLIVDFDVLEIVGHASDDGEFPAG